MALLGRRQGDGTLESSRLATVRSAIDRALHDLGGASSAGFAVVADNEEQVLDELLTVVHPGQLLVSDAAAGIEDMCDAEFVFLPLGTKRLEGGDGTLRRVLQVVHPGRKIAFPPLGTIDDELHGVPQSGGPFIGRQQEMGALSHALASSRVVSVVGPAGIGKTRLAREATLRSRHRWPDGIWWVDLHGARGLDGVADAVLRAADVDDARGLTTLDRAIAEFRHRAAVLVLDGCEDVRSEVAELAEAFSLSTAAIILCTSRRRLGSPQEVVIDLDVLPPDEAIALFRAYAGPAAEDLQGVHRVAVTGNPLALRLCAASSIQPLRPVASVEVALGRACATLGPSAQQTFRRLAVFADAFNGAAADAVAGRGAVGALGELVTAGLVDVADAGRYRLRHAIREFALRLLDEAGELDQCLGDHLAFHVALAESAGREIATSASTAALESIDDAHGDLLAAIARACGTDDDVDAVRIATALLPYWIIRGRYRDGVRVLGRWPDDPGATAGLGQVRLFAMDVTHGFGIANATAALSSSRSAHTTVARARALTHIGFLETFMGSPDGPDRLEEAAAVARSCDDRWSEIWATAGSLWSLSIARDAHDEAAPFLDAVGNLAARCENRFLEAVVDLGRGLRDLRCAGDLTTALPLLHGALAVCREVREPVMEMFAACAVSEAEILAGRWDDAERVLSVTLRRLARSALGRAEVVEVAIAQAAASKGEESRARAAVEAALGVVRSVGAPDLVAGALLVLARSRPGAADEALAIARTARNRRLEARALAMAGHLKPALELAWEAGYQPLVADLLDACVCGEVLSPRDAAVVGGAVDRERVARGWVRPVGDQARIEQVALAPPDGCDLAASIDHAVAIVLRPVEPELVSRLTRAEHAVAELVASGLPNVEVAGRLHISQATVKTHLVHVYAKLGVRNRAELAATWARAGG